MVQKLQPGKATAIGFGAGALVVIIAAALVLAPRFGGAKTTEGRAVDSPAPAIPAAKATSGASMPSTPAPHEFPPERSAPAGPPILSGTLALDPSITLSRGARVTVFVIARTRGGKGKTVLARRMDVAAFPTPFSLSSADSMMAGTRPEDVSIEARIDLDGDAMTREPGSAIATLTSVRLGTNAIQLTLKPEPADMRAGE
jgi:hypothetical protein